MALFIAGFVPLWDCTQLWQEFIRRRTVIQVRHLHSGESALINAHLIEKTAWVLVGLKIIDEEMQNAIGATQDGMACSIGKRKLLGMLRYTVTCAVLPSRVTTK